MPSVCVWVYVCVLGFVHVHVFVLPSSHSSVSWQRAHCRNVLLHTRQKSFICTQAVLLGGRPPFGLDQWWHQLCEQIVSLAWAYTTASVYRYKFYDPSTWRVKVRVAMTNTAVTSLSLPNTAGSMLYQNTLDWNVTYASPRVAMAERINPKEDGGATIPHHWCNMWVFKGFGRHDTENHQLIQLTSYHSITTSTKQLDLVHKLYQIRVRGYLLIFRDGT